MWDVRDVGCGSGMFARMWGVDLQNAHCDSSYCTRSPASSLFWETC